MWFSTLPPLIVSLVLLLGASVPQYVVSRLLLQLRLQFAVFQPLLLPQLQFFTSQPRLLLQQQVSISRLQLPPQLLVVAFQPQLLPLILSSLILLAQPRFEHAPSLPLQLRF